MKFRKDDPMYYRDKISNLIKQAIDEGLKVEVKHLDKGARLLFKADNGDIVGVKLTDS